MLDTAWEVPPAELPGERIPVKDEALLVWQGLMHGGSESS